MRHQTFFWRPFQGRPTIVTVTCFHSGITGILKPILTLFFFFQLEPPTDMPPPASTTPPGTTPPAPTAHQPATDPQGSPLRLSQEELKVCEKWIIPYSALETTDDRLKMLRGDILPRLAKVNTGMPEEIWKPRKSVSILYPRVK